MQSATKLVRIDTSGDGRFLNLRPTLSTSEAATALGVSRRVVRSYVNRRLIQAVIVGRSFRINTRSVEHLLTVGSAAVQADVSRPAGVASSLPLPDSSRDQFRARLVTELVDRDMAQSVYNMPIV